VKATARRTSTCWSRNASSAAERLTPGGSRQGAAREISPREWKYD
jgi:hypothetical protein